MSKFYIDPSQVNLAKLIPDLTDNPARDFIIADFSTYDSAVTYDLPSFHVTQKQEYLILGSKFGDTLLLDKYNDTVDGGKGNDTIYGGAGNDILFGNAGNDFLSGDKGNDLVRGGAGDDQVMGGEGNDTLFGGDGNDFGYFIGGGTDVGYMGDGNDYVNIADGNKNTKVFLEAGDDGAFVAGVNSIVYGGAGNDSLLAANKGVTIDGGAGNDTLEVVRTYVGYPYGDGSVTKPDASVHLTGGAGKDTFVFTLATTATITDFVHGQDKIDLSSLSYLIENLDFHDITFEHQGNNLIAHANVTYHSPTSSEVLHGPTMILENFSGNLTASDFIFGGAIGSPF